MSDAAALHHYAVFGLHVASEIPLPDLRAHRADGVPDVTIVRAAIAQARGSTGEVAHFDDGSLLRIGGIARFWVSEGRRVVVEAADGVPDRNICVFLLGSAMALVLHQRGHLPLHANAFAVDGGAVAIMGPSGAGKSTLAAFFADRRYALLTDDVCVVRLDRDGVPIASPGIPRLRLWRDAVERSGRSPGDYSPSFTTAPHRDKFDVPIAADGLALRPVPLRALYVLDPADADTVSIETLSPAAALRSIVANTYRGRYIHGSVAATRHFRSCQAIASHVPVFVTRRPWSLDRIGETGEAIERHILRVGAASGVDH